MILISSKTHTHTHTDTHTHTHTHSVIKIFQVILISSKTHTHTYTHTHTQCYQDFQSPVRLEIHKHTKTIFGHNCKLFQKIHWNQKLFENVV